MHRILSRILALLSLAVMAPISAWGQSPATQIPLGEQCFQATTGQNGLIGLLGTIAGGSGGTAGTYAAVPLTGGSGTNATANITVAGGAVTQVTLLNPGGQYVVGDTLSAASANIGGVTGFSVPVLSVSINSSLAGGSATYYVPNTLTFKNTYQDANQVTLNPNPVALDQNGCALVYGSGIYRQILKDSLGNTVWDRLTTAPTVTPFWAGLSGGTGIAITVIDTAFANQDGYLLQFRAANTNSTGPVTLAVSGGSPIQIVKDTTTGPASLTGGEIVTGNIVTLVYDATNIEWHLQSSTVASSSQTLSGNITQPQGYLNLLGAATGNVIQTSDVIGASVVYYSPFVGSEIPIYNGSNFILTQFSELTVTLTGTNTPADTIQDACIFSNNGVLTLVVGPSWQTITVGSASRGIGAGTPQLVRLQGIWVNAVQIIGNNGGNTFTIAANRCTYVGSIYADHTAGQVTAHRSYGQNRKFGVWNAFNRQPIFLKAGDPTASWTYASATVRASNNNPSSLSSGVCNVGSGTTCNGVTVFQGLAEETVTCSEDEFANFVTEIFVGCGANSITAVSGTKGQGGANSEVGLMLHAFFPTVPVLGPSAFFALESGASGITNNFFGTEPVDVLAVQYRG